MRNDPIRSRLIEAIHAQRLGEVANALLADRSQLDPEDLRLVDAARQACIRISEEVGKEANRVASLLGQASIPCEIVETDANGFGLQNHCVELLLDVDDPTKAVTLMRRHGYWHPLSTRHIPWLSYRRNHKKVTLTRFDDASTRLVLHWRGTEAGAPWQDLFLAVLQDPAGAARVLQRRVARLFGKVPAGQADGQFLGNPLSTPRSLIPELLRFARVSRDDVLVDIGCGDGRVLIEAARTSGCRGIGVEIQRGMYRTACEAIHEQQLGDRVAIVHGDAETVSLDDASVVFLFVPVQSLGEFLPHLLSRAPSGTRIIAHEQMPLVDTLPPLKSSPLISDAAVTVAHLWQAG